MKLDYKKILVFMLTTVFFIQLYSEEGNLVGKQDLIFRKGGTSPNGYTFYTNRPDKITGIWSVDKGYKNAGVIGIQCSEKGGYGAWEMPRMDFKPGAKYNISLMALNTESTDKSSLAVDIYAFNKENKPKRIFVIGLQNPLEAKSWYELKGSFVCPNDSVRLRVRLYLTTPGEVYYDNLRIEDKKQSEEAATVLTADGWKLNNSISWIPLRTKVKTAELPQKLVVFDGKKVHETGSALQEVVNSPVGIDFKLTGEVSTLCSMLWLGRISPVQLPENSFVILDYKTNGITSFVPVRNLLELDIKGTAENKDVSILSTDLALSDNLEHTLVKRIDKNLQVNGITAGIVTESEHACLSVNNLRFSLSAPKLFNHQIKIIEAINHQRFTTVPLGDKVNDSLKEVFERNLKLNSLVIDGLYEFPSALINVSGVPFKVIVEDKNIISPPNSQNLQYKRTKFLGEEVIAKNFCPVSRNDAITLKIRKKASEVLLLLALVAPYNQKRYGLPPRPLKLNDIENVAVEIVYASGDSEIAFPYSLADKASYVPYRMLGAYAVSTDINREIEKIILHNNMFNLNFSIAAVTLNKGKAVAPELTSYCRPGKTLNPDNTKNEKLYIFKDSNSLLHISNSFYKYIFNLKDGFSIISVVNKFGAGENSINIAPSSGVAIRTGNSIYTGRCFKVTDLKINNGNAAITLDSDKAELPLRIRLVIEADETAELKFLLEVENKGKKSFEFEASFPVINNLKIGSLTDTRMFFPQYRAVDTGDKMFLKSPFGMPFQFQFMDTYNPRLGLGIMTMTRNTIEEMMNFVMSKDDNGVSSMISFPEEYNKLLPSGKKTYPEFSLTVHNGDWHEAVDIYKKRLHAWYKPHNSQNKDFFLNAFDVKAYILDDKLSRHINRVPGVLTEDKKHYKWDEIFETEKNFLGHISDIIHFFHWFHDAQNNLSAYGNVATEEAYSRSGGDKFMETIAFLQNDIKRPVSLYTIADRFDRAYMPEEKGFGSNIAMCRENGSELANSNTVYTCNYVKKWRDFVISQLVKMQKDTGTKIIYLDVFASFPSKKCYSSKHGHPIPSNPLKIDKLFLKELKDRLPEDVVIWTEYPHVDVTSQYVDGSIHYYFLELSQRFARPYGAQAVGSAILEDMPFNLTRYITPTYRQFTLPVGIEGSRKPSQVDASFFNGEGFHEVTWRLHPSRIREKINLAYKLKHEYADCFRSSDVMPRVFTLAQGIRANRFKGEKRILWTLYNTRPNTYTGPVLEVDHINGCKYYDAWNRKELHPEIKNGKAFIVLKINPKTPACVVQARP